MSHYRLPNGDVINPSHIISVRIDGNESYTWLRFTTTSTNADGTQHVVEVEFEDEDFNDTGHHEQASNTLDDYVEFTNK